MKTYVLVAVAVVGGLFVVMLVTGGGNEGAEVMGAVEQLADAEVSTVTVPADLPANVPLYPGSVLDAVNDVPGAQERNVTLTLITLDSVAAVVAWYRGALSAEGWAVTDDRNVGGYILLKGENENVTVFVQSTTGTDGTTAITERIRVR